MQFTLGRENYGKLVLISATTLIWLLLLILFKVYGYHQTWELWKVPTWDPPFLDFRLIPGSADSFRHGYEPSVENPYDTTQRIFNYPAFWRLFFYTGITQDDTIWISVTMIVLFFIAVFLFPERLSLVGAVAMLLVIFSPAAMLLYERGNVDLIVFFLCVMIVLASSYSASLAAGLIAFASIVKLFPFFGVTILLKEANHKFWSLFAGCCLILTVYMVATWNSVKASWNLTMRGDTISYGTNVIVTQYGEMFAAILSRWLSHHRTELLLKYGPHLVGLILLLAITVLAVMNTQGPETVAERNLAAFRMGASIYVGTFLLGNNWDYRLAFLVLVVPQIVDWFRSEHKLTHILAWFSMFLVLVSCWHFWISVIPLESIFGSTVAPAKFWMILDETVNWLLFASLAYLLVVSLPNWLKTPARNFLPVKS
jgi:hypothetical protein